MSDNEQQPPTPQLTRRQLRELRNTASNPIIVDPDAIDDASAIGGEQTPAPVPLPRAADPVEVPPAPVPQASVDLGSPALTRRQARLQEKIRTASIPVVTATGEHPTVPTDHEEADAAGASAEPVHDGVDEAETGGPADDGAPAHDDAEPDIDGDSEESSDAPEDGAEADAKAEAEEHDRDVLEDGAHADVDAESRDDDAPESEPSALSSGEPDVVEYDAAASEALETVDDEPAASSEPEADERVDDDEEPERHVVSNDLGADLLAGESTATDVPTSFDQLLSRSAAATGAFTTPNALILAENPDGGPLVAPVTATGEVLITGTFTLPESFGSTGVVPGVADGKEVDAVLVDGELPASSSPTPIAASAAISTIKSAEDVIRPPAPEKGSRWTVALAITAGALALALAGVLLVSLFTGVFG